MTALLRSTLTPTVATTHHPRYRFVDDLRGIAAVAVMFTHTVWLLPGPFFADIDGTIGIEAFFTLSGFVMAALLARQRVDGRYAVGFLARRSIRLDPPYWAVLLLEIVLLVTVWSEPLPGLKTFVFNVVYLQELSDVPSIVYVAWTLCLELQFYIVLVVLYAVVQRLPWSLWTSRAVVFGPLAVASVVIGLGPWSIPGIDSLVHNHGFFGGWWFTFFLGMLTHWVMFEGLSKHMGALLPAGLVLLVPLAGVSVYGKWGPSPVVCVATAGLLVGANRFGLLERGLNRPLTTYLGKISYSLYLVHIAVGTNLLFFVADNYGESPHFILPAFVMAWLLSFGAAHLLHRYVEQPAHRLSRHIGERRPRGMSPVTAFTTGVCLGTQKTAPGLVKMESHPPATHARHNRTQPQDLGGGPEDVR